MTKNSKLALEAEANRVKKRARKRRVGQFSRHWARGRSTPVLHPCSYWLCVTKRTLLSNFSANASTCSDRLQKRKPITQNSILYWFPKITISDALYGRPAKRTARLGFFLLMWRQKNFSSALSLQRWVIVRLGRSPVKSNKVNRNPFPRKRYVWIQKFRMWS